MTRGIRNHNDLVECLEEIISDEKLTTKEKTLLVDKVTLMYVECHSIYKEYDYDLYRNESNGEAGILTMVDIVKNEFKEPVLFYNPTKEELESFFKNRCLLNDIDKDYESEEIFKDNDGNIYGYVRVYIFDDYGNGCYVIWSGSPKPNYEREERERDM